MADARPFISDVGRIPKFDANWNINSIRTRWHQWKRGFEPFATGKGVVDPGQKTALLLHTAGISTQDNYLTMEIPEPGEGANVYDVTARLLNNQFTPHVKTTHLRDHNSELWHKCPMKLFINTLLGWDRKLSIVISILMTRTSETKLLKNVTPCCSSFSVFCVVLLCVFTFWVPCCDVRYDFRMKRCL